jgi:hypothetical protein
MNLKDEIKEALNEIETEERQELEERTAKEIAERERLQPIVDKAIGKHESGFHKFDLFNPTQKTFEARVEDILDRRSKEHWDLNVDNMDRTCTFKDGKIEGSINLESSIRRIVEENKPPSDEMGFVGMFFAMLAWFGIISISICILFGWGKYTAPPIEEYLPPTATNIEQVSEDWYSYEIDDQTFMYDASGDFVKGEE